MGDDVTGTTTGARLTGVFDRALITTARRARTTSRWPARVVVVAASVATVLGVVGWYQVGAEDADLSILTIVYGTVALFAFAGTDVADAPLTLQVARLVAPIATAGAVIGVSIRLGHGAINQFSSRRIHRHLLLVGPRAIVEDHRQPSDPALVVHAGPEGEVPVGDAVHVPFAPDAPDWDLVSLAASARVVVATGSDLASLQLVEPVWDHLRSHASAEATIELQDRDTALALAVERACADPSISLDVVCREALTASLTAATVLGEADAAPDRAFAVVGGGRFAALLAEEVADHLRARAHQTGLRPRLAVLLLDADVEALAARISDWATMDTRFFASLDELLAWSPPGLVSVVDHPDADESLRLAVALRLQVPTGELFLRSTAASLPLGLRPVELGRLADAGEVLGPWLQVARHRAGDRWPSLDRRARLDAAGDVRRAIAALVGVGWQIRPGRGVRDGQTLLPPAALADLGLPSALDDLPFALRDVGLVLHPPVGGEGGAP